MKTFRYVGHHHVSDYLQLGWHIADLLDGTPHGRYSLLLQWLCDCKCVEPA